MKTIIIVIVNDNQYHLKNNNSCDQGSGKTVEKGCD